MTRIRAMKEADLPAVWRLIKESKILDTHTPYTYWVQLNMYPTLMFVAEEGVDIVGFVSGLAHFRRDHEVFVWQIGVHEAYRKRGLGMALLNTLHAKSMEQGFTLLSMTVTEDNAPSIALFEKFARSLGAEMRMAGTTGTLGNNMKNEIIYEIAIQLPGDA